MCENVVTTASFGKNCSSVKISRNYKKPKLISCSAGKSYLLKWFEKIYLKPDILSICF